MPRIIFFPGLSLLALSLTIGAIASSDTPKSLVVNKPVSTAAIQAQPSSPANYHQAMQVAIVWN